MDISSNDLLRPLGALEELFWLLDQGAPVHFLTIAEIQGEASVLEWRQALDALQQRHPLLSVCIDSAFSRVPHFRVIDNQRIPLRVVEGSTAWEREAELELRTLFTPRQAPLIRAVLLRSSQKSVIILATHHAVADGLSGVFLLRDLLTALSGKPLERSEAVPSRDQLFDVPVRTSTEPGRGVLDNAGAIAMAQSPVSVRTRKISAAQINELRIRARREETTIHGALCAAVAWAGRRIERSWNTGSVRLYSPISCRELLGLKDQCTVAITSGKYVVNPGTTESFWDLARNSRKALLPFLTKEGNQGPLNAVNQAILSNMTPQDASKLLNTALAAEAMISNLGVIPIPEAFGRFTLESIWGPCVLRGIQNEQIIGISSIGGELHIVQTSRDPFVGLLEEMEAVLLEACLPVAGEAAR